MSIDGIIFDVEDIFFDGTFWHRYLHHAICRLAGHRSFAEVQTAWQSKFLPQVYGGQTEYWDALASFFRMWGLSECEVSELLVAARSRMKMAQTNLRLFPRVSDTLHRLKTRGLKLGILCNSIHQPETFAEMLAKIGVHTKLDAIITSRFLGRALPDKAAFAEIANLIGCQPQRLVYVSARASRLQVSREAGLRCVGVIHQAPVPPPHTSSWGSVTIRDLQDLGDALFQSDTERGQLAL